VLGLGVTATARLAQHSTSMQPKRSLSAANCSGECTHVPPCSSASCPPSRSCARWPAHSSSGLSSHKGVTLVSLKDPTCKTPL
jgi:hypothetical protein